VFIQICPIKSIDSEYFCKDLLKVLVVKEIDQRRAEVDVYFFSKIFYS